MNKREWKSADFPPEVTITECDGVVCSPDVLCVVRHKRTGEKKYSVERYYRAGATGSWSHDSDYGIICWKPLPEFPEGFE